MRANSDENFSNDDSFKKFLKFDLKLLCWKIIHIEKLNKKVKLKFFCLLNLLKNKNIIKINIKYSVNNIKKLLVKINSSSWKFALIKSIHGIKLNNNNNKIELIEIKYLL